jgi:2-methylcitrate dehydratase
MMDASEPITASISRWATRLEFEQLSPAAVYQAKRFLLDSLGCALGGYRQRDVQIYLELMREVAGTGTATVIGSGQKVDALSGALANALMIRVLDFNDIYWKQDPSHPSDIIPSAIACCERRVVDGKELIVAMVLGYEFAMRLSEAAFPGIRERGWHHATLTALAAPIAAARALRLDAQRMQHAIGISGSHMATVSGVVAGKLSMMKNTVDPLAAHSGVLAALLAERGYTGPEGVIDGKEGLVHALGPEWRLSVLTDGLGESWRIEQCGMKAFPTEALTHTPLSAVLELVKKHDLTPKHIAKVQVRTLARAVDILADPSKYDPHTKETADHSLPYCVAAAIVDHQLTPAQFTQDKIENPLIRAQLNKVEVVADDEIEKVFPELQRAAVAIITTNGDRYDTLLDYPKGDFRNPLSDEELEQKFDALAAALQSARARRELKRAVWQLEHLQSVSMLMDLCKADQQSADESR